MIQTYQQPNNQFYQQEIFVGFNRKRCLPEKDLLEKAASMKRFEYLPSGSELK